MGYPLSRTGLWNSFLLDMIFLYVALCWVPLGSPLSRTGLWNSFLLDLIFFYFALWRVPLGSPLSRTGLWNSFLSVMCFFYFALWGVPLGCPLLRTGLWKSFLFEKFCQKPRGKPCLRPDFLEAKICRGLWNTPWFLQTPLGGTKREP